MDHHKTERGSALIYILIAIALLAVLTASFMDSSSQQTTSQNTFNTVTDLNTQINFIRSSVHECVLTYPEGDQSSAFAATTPTNIPYPILPTSSYFTGSTLGVAPDDAVKFLRCPGNPGTNNNHAVIFGGSSGKFLPPAPKLFSEWYYYNGNDGVYFVIGSDKTDAFISTALQKLDDQFSECEADIIDATAAPAYLTTDNSTAIGLICPVGHLCFRVWMIAGPDAIYPNDVGGDEAACPLL